MLNQHVYFIHLS